MAKGIIAVSRQPECCVDYKKDNVILTEASGKSEEITSQVKMLSDNQLYLKLTKKKGSKTYTL